VQAPLSAAGKSSASNVGHAAEHAVRRYRCSASNRGQRRTGRMRHHRYRLRINRVGHVLSFPPGLRPATVEGQLHRCSYTPPASPESPQGVCAGPAGCPRSPSRRAMIDVRTRASLGFDPCSTSRPRSRRRCAPDGGASIGSCRLLAPPVRRSALARNRTPPRGDDSRHGATPLERLGAKGAPYRQSARAWTRRCAVRRSSPAVGLRRSGPPFWAVASFAM
jgi:hypothetical protein